MADTENQIKPTRIAVAGAGTIGQAHMAVIAGNRDWVLSAIVDPSPAADGLANQFGLPLYKSLAALLAQDRPDGIILATPNPLHVPQALACIEAGVPALLEKPIATTVEEAQTLVDQPRPGR
jgi:predicted dehydrogenase